MNTAAVMAEVSSNTLMVRATTATGIVAFAMELANSTNKQVEVESQFTKASGTTT